MAKQQAIYKELIDLQVVLTGFPGGASIDTIQFKLGESFSQRTLQRRLAILLKDGIIRTTGQGRSLQYHITTPTEALVEEPQATYGLVIPLSVEGRAIQQVLQRPLEKRTPKGYEASFLRNYRPNIDFYLTVAERARLHEIGQTAGQDQAAGTYVRQILQRLLIDLSWNSSRLEGNTYSLLDTQRLLSQGLIADNKAVTDAQMILNHKDAIEFLVESAEEIGFNRYTITNLHGLLAHDLLFDAGAPGRLRTFAVGIGRSVYTPLAIPQQIEEFFDLLLEKVRQIDDPFEQAFFVMVQLPYLQPFDDVNKRVSRLAANIPLNRHNLAPLSFVEVPKDLYIQGLLGVYELQRIGLLKDVFLWAYERSSLLYATVSQSIGKPDPFRQRYRNETRTLVAEIISGALTQTPAQERIDAYASRIPVADRTKFIEMVQLAILGLHEGNFARYKIRPSQFAAWKKEWDGKGA